MSRGTVITALVLLIEIPGWSQQSVNPTDSLAGYFQFEDSSPLSCLVTYLPPFFIRNGMELKSFIRSKRFAEIRKQYGDRRSVDAIFVRAMRLTNDNTAVALLLATLSTFDHSLVQMRVPIMSLCLPLSSESEEDFDRRVKDLPSQLYSDTPPEGDHDKLQHFFGSAFIALTCESSGSAERVGNFVEVGEDAFIEGGVLDVRDMRANRQGQRFGMALLEDNHQYPSKFLVVDSVRTSTGASHGSGVQK
ncbi:MAG TPA: hypothetical protein VLY03_07905 [Bacteroidota bacterium]|nr:hypothetical protein [Bacteroidota bacterium]